MIDMWGMNTFDDLHFKYLVDQKKITGPHLKVEEHPKDLYAHGLLSPWAFRMANDVRAENKRLHAPFSSANYGPRPVYNSTGARGSWYLTENDNTTPLGQGRGTRTLAQSMYTNVSADGDGTAPYVAGPDWARRGPADHAPAGVPDTNAGVDTSPAGRNT